MSAGSRARGVLWRTVGEAAASDDEIIALQANARRAGVVCYAAYNHRFEPHYVRMRDLLAAGELGTIYSCRMFYGNGTARLVRDSAWRDQGAGVLPDLGSHLLDTCRFWFGSAGSASVRPGCRRETACGWWRQSP